MSQFKNLLFLIGCLVLIGCQEEVNDPTQAFSRIYDDSDATISFKPIDVVPLTEGYLILAEKKAPNATFPGVTLHRINAEGNYVTEIDLSDDYVLPSGKMALIDSIAYFVAMDPISLDALLIGVNSDNRTTIQPLASSYPLAVNWTSEGAMLLLSYNPQNLQSVLTLYNLDGTASGQAAYSIGPGSDVQQEILDHYIDNDRYGLDFFCGEWSAGNYYFNGFYNYSLSLVFTDLGGNPTGVIQGQSSDGGISDVMVISGSDFALAGYQFNEVFVNPAATLNTGAISSSIDLFDATVSEFRPRTPFSIANVLTGTTNHTVIAAETEARQIALYFYTPAGALESIQKIGYINPYTVTSVKSDAENNLLILGTTFVGGRFERIYFQKISNNTLSSWVQ